jgi:hypothetical protein
MSPAAALFRRRVPLRRFPALPILVVAGTVLCGGGGRLAAPRAQDSTEIALITIVPAVVTIGPGRAQHFVVAAVDRSGRPVSVTLVWSATGGTITAAGLYTAGSFPGTYRVIAMASGSSLADTATVTVGNVAPASNPGPANGPSGCHLVYEDAFAALNGAGIASPGVGPLSVSGDPLVAATVTIDPSAPASPPSVLQVTFGTGWGGATSPGVALMRPLTGDYASLYLSVWVFLDPGWPGPGAGPDMALSFASGPLLGDRVRFDLGVMQGGQLLPHMRVTGLARSYHGSISPLLVANVDSQPRLTPGVWHELRMQVVSNGTGTSNDGLATWWLDGVLAGSYGGIGLWSGAAPAIREIGIEATPPPTPLIANHFLRLDHWYATGLTPPTVGTGTGPDLVQVSGNTTITPSGLVTPPELAVFMRARAPATPPCLDDHVVDDILASTFPSLLARGDCRPDVIGAFSVDNAARLDAGECDAGAIWTAAGAELRDEALAPLLTVPVVLWLTQELNSAEQATATGQPLEPLALAELGDATDLFNLNRAGVLFKVVDTKRLWSLSAADQAAAHTAITAPTGSIDDCAPALAGSSYFKPGKVNVYYVESLPITGAAGLTCRRVDANIIYISNDDRGGTTLAHELGHALSLEHIGDHNSGPWYVGIGNTNLMWGTESADRASLTLGQVYRANGDARSVLHRDQLRGGPRWVCECTFGQPGCETWLKYRDSTSIDGVCPRVTRDWN